MVLSSLKLLQFRKSIEKETLLLLRINRNTYA